MSPRPRRQRGSALISAIFVLVLVGVVGLVLLHSSRIEVRTSLADVRSKKVFYFAEAGLETARDQLRLNNSTSTNSASLDEELTAAAGPNGAIDFSPDALRVVYDAAGKPTGFTGYGDDIPLRAFTALADGYYAAFMTNDRVEGPGILHDGNGRVLLTAVGAGRDRSFEEVQSLVELPVPTVPATITLLGPNPVFDGGDSAAKDYAGNDCSGAAGYTGAPGQFVPIIGTIGTAAVTSVVTGIRKPDTYNTGPYTGNATARDISSTVDPRWTDCASVVKFARMIRDSADYRCTVATPCSHWATSTMSTITYAEGDATIPTGKGLLLVTGRLSTGGGDSWDGVVFVIGKGEASFSGGGAGHNFGGTVLANVAGPDRILFTADDCSAAPDGFGPSSYIVNGGGNKDTIFCNDAIAQATAGFPMQTLSFRQR